MRACFEGYNHPNLKLEQRGFSLDYPAYKASRQIVLVAKSIAHLHDTMLIQCREGIYDACCNWRLNLIFVFIFWVVLVASSHDLQLLLKTKLLCILYIDVTKYTISQSLGLWMAWSTLYLYDKGYKNQPHCVYCIVVL